MNITLVGLILIPLGLYGILFNSKLLYTLTIFFIPFTATAVLVIGDDDGSVLLATVFFGLLWIIQTVISNSVSKNLFKSKSSLPIGGLLLILFLLNCYVSIFLIPLNGNFQIFSIDIGRFVPLSFEIYHIYHLFFISYGVLFSICMIKHNDTLEKLIGTLKIYTFAIVFAILWGLVEVYSNIIGSYFPYFIFNNTPSDAQLGDTVRKLGEIGFFRMSSVGDEPSMIARTILISLPLYLTSYSYGINIFSRKLDTLILFIISLGLFASASSSALSGAVIIFIGSILLKAYLESRFLKPFLIIFSIIFLASIFYLNNQQFASFLDFIFLGKLSSDSFFERLATVTDSLEVFKALPFFGAGFGSITSDDLIIKLLSNTGIFGFLLFIFMLILTQVGLLTNLKKSPVKSKYLMLLQISISLMFFTYWSITQIGGWSHQFQTGFFALGLALSFVSIKDNFFKQELNLKA